jgi:hypothetical protein
MNQPTNFSARADQAALALKARLSAETGKTIAPRSVPVGPNGQPAPPLPPEGSYARQAIEHQRAAAAQQRPQLQTRDDQQQQPNPQEEQVHQNGDPQAGQQPQAQELTPNAQRRFSQLTDTLRQKDQALQQAEARAKELQETNAQTQARLQAIEERFNAMVNQNLDALDPETRQQVMQQAAIDESVAQIEKRVMQRVSPIVDRVTTQAVQSELVAVSQRYPGFSAEVHGPLIEIFRKQNPNCTIEQAFRAVAEPEELVQGRQERAPAIPPIAVPQSVNAAPRYAPQPRPQQTTPEQEIEADRKRAFDLARSTDPLDRREAGRAMDRYLAKKLGNALPGRR